jgi:single-stranded-DNA-specific exonuclease
MTYKILYEDRNQSLIQRILTVRNIDCEVDDFLAPNMHKYWTDPYLLSDMLIAVDRIIDAMKRKEKIMIFADYDVDGVTSSYMLYTFIRKYIKYQYISIEYPDRFKDGYGIKKHHIDAIKAKWCSVIVTVDNGITAVDEALHAKKIGIDLIITDHHEVAESWIPQAYAVVNPQTSPQYIFKWLCGAAVSFKVICALMEKTGRDRLKKKTIFNYFLPIVAIATVADCVPLVKENRVLVQRGFHIINTKRETIPAWLQWLLKYLNITKPIDSFHVWFMIGPRINAGWRIGTPFDSLRMLLYEGEKQLEHLDKLESLNSERKELQDTAYKIAESQVDPDKNMVVAMGTDFHEWIVGIVAGRLAEKHNKPCAVFALNEEEGKAVASLRGPKYFHVVEMLKTMDHLLLRYGWHKQAGWLTCDIAKLPEIIEHMQQYCSTHITTADLEQPIEVDTLLYDHEWTKDELQGIDQLAPFGVGNEEPLLLLEKLIVTDIERVGNKWSGHLKLHAQLGGNKLKTMFWKQGDNDDGIQKGEINLIGKIKPDSYNGGYFVEGKKIVD